MQKESILCVVVVLLCVGFACHIVLSPARGGGLVGRASGSQPAAKLPSDTSCCLIPANKGLYP